MMYEVVTRTMLGRRLFRPSREVTAGILGVLARALVLYEVALHAFVYLSNHAHLLLSAARGADLGGFMCHVNRNTALVAMRVNDWNEPVWDRYQPTPVLDDTASVERLRYILANGVKEGLVESPFDWPGATSARALALGEPLHGRWHQKVRSVVVDTKSIPIELAPLPCWAGLPAPERARRVQALVGDVIAWGHVEREGRAPLGVDGLLRADPLVPVPLEHTPPPRAHASDPRILAAFEAQEEAFANAYRAASRSRRNGKDATFPPCAYPPAPPFEGGS